MEKIKMTRVLLVGTILCILGSLILTDALAKDVQKMTKEELKGMLDSPDLIILDVRTGRDWDSSEFKIQGSIRAKPGDFAKWAPTHPKEKTLVLYFS